MLLISLHPIGFINAEEFVILLSKGVINLPEKYQASNFVISWFCSLY